MGGRIDCYVDIVSFYSWVGFEDLRQNTEKLAAHGVQVEVLICAPDAGNKPPWILPAKAIYLARDARRAAARLSLPYTRGPRDLMVRAKTLSPLRALHFIKANYPLETFLSTLDFFFHKLWMPPHVNLVDDANLVEALTEATETPEGGKELFTPEDVQKIMDARDSMKDSVKDLTAQAIERGAFGAPWLWVTNSEGKEMSFFGSDRFNHIYRFLGIPFQDVTVLPPSKL
ncbi:thioredoxin-like protein [Mariannaea sp. PMI_226]|nr:thioredoxin-like protein [Mariannaea sp. PMI_226]